MAVTPSVQEYLRRSQIAYSVFHHLPAYSAQEEAAVTHVPGRDWAKAVVCSSGRWASAKALACTFMILS